MSPCNRANTIIILAILSQLRLLSIVKWNTFSFSLRPFVKWSKFSIIFRKINIKNYIKKIRLYFINILNIYLLLLFFLIFFFLFVFLFVFLIIFLKFWFLILWFLILWRLLLWQWLPLFLYFYSIYSISHNII